MDIEGEQMDSGKWDWLGELESNMMGLESHAKCLIFVCLSEFMEGGCHALPYDSQMIQAAMRRMDTMGSMGCLGKGKEDCSWAVA